MQHRLSNRISGIEKSATYDIFDMVRNLRTQGASILDLGGGEPDFSTPPHITEAAVAALSEGFTHYTPSRGIPELLEALSEKLAKDNGIHAEAVSDIIVTPSAKHALYICFLSVLDPGDEILVPTPSWVSYGAMAQLAGARPVPVPLAADQGFRLSRDRLERQVSGATKAIVVNTPNNPTGHVLDEDEARDIAEFAAAHDLFVISDEIYEKIRYGGARHLSPASLPSCADRTLTVNGFSKGYAMTGWRLGYVAGPAGVIGDVLKAQQHTVGCAGSFVQRGALAALTGPQEPVQDMADEYAARRKLVVDGLNALPGVSCSAPGGAFYAFADIRGTGFDDSAEFATWLLTTAGVAVTPGTAFGPGGEGHVRLSFATSRDVIEQALDRVGAALAARS
ncbi:pyridoxal phosphate-dependent aminotransferase [Streptomyces alboflavus]|uniref:pyridoxal phosphate-dependent aminotransferase n=1 Tax=Streptomyces alboflavus TaxID=67267 RepID=UPI0004C1DD1C|nr:pyridoxal phosphate-dependent aminotransferase [Streptomyces alboflavus]